MKNFLLSILLVAAFAACATPKDAVLRVDIGNVKSDSIFTWDDAGVVYYTRGKDGKFRVPYTRKMPAPLKLGTPASKEQVYLFLEPNDSLNIKTDFAAHTSFSGKGFANSKWYHENMMKYIEGYNKLDARTAGYQGTYDQSEKLWQDMIDNLEANKKSLTKAFYDYQSVSLKYYQLSDPFMVVYIFNAALHHKLSDLLNDKFWSMEKKVEVNEKWMDIESYRGFMAGAYPKFLRYKQLKAEGKLDDSTLTADQLFKMDYQLVQRNYTGKMRELVLGIRLFGLLNSSQDLPTIKPLLDEYLKEYPQAKDAAKLKQAYAKVLELSAGNIPPYFELKDIEGNTVTLKKFSGKIIYLDFWASWCAPCRYEMKNGSPKLHEQFKDEKDVVFLYISIDDSEDKWKKAIDDDKIKGIHLLSKGGMSSDVAKAFNIQGVPRYMIIGKDGRIVNSDATRPSQPETAETLRKLLSI